MGSDSSTKSTVDCFLTNLHHCRDPDAPPHPQLRTHALKSILFTPPLHPMAAAKQYILGSCARARICTVRDTFSGHGPHASEASCSSYFEVREHHPSQITFGVSMKQHGSSLATLECYEQLWCLFFRIVSKSITRGVSLKNGWRTSATTSRPYSRLFVVVRTSVLACVLSTRWSRH